MGGFRIFSSITIQNHGLFVSEGGENHGLFDSEGVEFTICSADFSALERNGVVNNVKSFPALRSCSSLISGINGRQEETIKFWSKATVLSEL